MGEFIFEIILGGLVVSILAPLFFFIIIIPGSVVCSMVSFFTKTPKSITYFYTEKQAVSITTTLALALLFVIML